MNKSLQGRFREVIHNNYTLYYFVYMYTQICDEIAGTSVGGYLGFSPDRCSGHLPREILTT
jgi:hypothetical protein